MTLSGSELPKVTSHHAKQASQKEKVQFKKSSNSDRTCLLQSEKETCGLALPGCI
jgi:hypothetical protein